MEENKDSSNTHLNSDFIFKKPAIIVGNVKSKTIRQVNPYSLDTKSDDSLIQEKQVQKKPSPVAKSDESPAQEKQVQKKPSPVAKSDDSPAQEKQVQKEPSPVAKSNDSPREESYVENKKKLDYVQPLWSGTPEIEYLVKEVKNGLETKIISIYQKPYWTIGKDNICNITLEHPSISRHHAVIQYITKDDNNLERGYYIYDLGSTHGTFLNKQRIPPKKYIRVKVGHIIKFGFSTRMYILEGPSEDEEPESEMSWTQLNRREHFKLKAKELQTKVVEDDNEDHFNWGQDEDDVIDLSDNPFAVTENEELYIDDPKKTLEGWFEREGEELEFKVENIGYAQYICRVELPIGVAEVDLKGKKKEAIVQCALEACRMLDRHGLLYQANQESRKKQVQKDWEAMDYYDSDEDNFFDRTGEIEKKRRKRMIRSGKTDEKPETYENLVKMYEDLMKDLEAKESKLSVMQEPVHVVQDNSAIDTLDDFMSNLKETKCNAADFKYLKNEIDKLKVEKERLQKLINIARPTELPPIASTSSNNEENSSSIVSPKTNVDLNKDDTATNLKYRVSTTENQLKTDSEEIKVKSLNTSTEKEEKRPRCAAAKQKQSLKQKYKQIKEDDPDTDDYSNWTPPVGQTGDGRTHLNDKLGY